MKLDSIATQVSLDQIPNVFVGKVKALENKPKKQGGMKINATIVYLGPENATVFNIQTKQNTEVKVPLNSEVSEGWNIPKVLTGHGQMDVLFARLKQLGIEDTDLLKDRTFVFAREALPGSMQGNARHYPVQEIKDPKEIPAALKKFQTV